MTQLIWTGNEYEIASDANSELPVWPVQDEGGRWHQKQFAGQRVAYDRQRASFGFRVKKLTDEEVKKLDLDDLPDNVFAVQNGTQGFVFYRER